MGRAKKPTALRLVEGTRDRRPAAAKAKEPVPKNPLGPAPKGMTDREREVWATIGKELPPGMLALVDGWTVTAFCRAVAIADEAAHWLRNPPQRQQVEGQPPPEQVGDIPLLMETPNGFLQPNAYLSIINKQAVIIKTLGAELGLSPAARTRIQVGNDGEDETDPTAKYFA